MAKKDFLLYTFVILLVGVGLGMTWRAHQVEPRLNQKIATLERQKRELAQEYTDASVRLTLIEKRLRIKHKKGG